MDNNEITVTQALNQIQSWLNAGEFDKVTQGCQEILQIEPGNQRALALMKMAEEKKAGAVAEAPAPQPKQNDIPVPSNFEEEAKAQLGFDSPIDENSMESRKTAMMSERKLHFLAMLIPAILVVIIGGGIIWYISDSQREEIIDDIEDAPIDNTYIEENEKRAEDLTAMSQVIESYKKEHGAYPSVKEIEDVLMDSKKWKEVPSDPRHGEFDKNKNEFGYIYAVYPVDDKENMEYIISAIFEDSKGFAYPWSKGASAKKHIDFRDLNKDNVILVGADGKSGEERSEEEDKPKVKVKRT